ncbi:unnamed protein product [Arabis nemorensis]|uniref:SUEL-type lectin domain-containing protein n=1 Tax=Arabis nemorensis TaxID=586526 RepID=A0A565BW02_9BRAS|nr:unnamed protein product [Arabis nemorensis]
MNVSFHGDRKRIMSGSIQAPSSEPIAYEYTVCSDHSETEGKPQPSSFDCEKGDVLSAIKYADYGQSTGSCEKYKRGKCGSRDTLNIVKKKCLGKRKCELSAPDKILGPTYCKGAIRLVIEATCKKT